MTDSYVWWPSYRRDTSDLGNPRTIIAHLLGVAVLGALLCLPSIVAATGIAPQVAVTLLGIHAVWTLIGTFVIAARATEVRASAFMGGNLVINTGIAVAIPIATGDPRTPLWMLPVVYACINGALQERERCITFLLVHALSPLVAIALLDGRTRDEWRVAAPVLCAVLCGVGYDHLASVCARWRRVRADQEAALAKAELEILARQRERFAGDLHASVGSTLAIVGMYARLITAHIDDAEELRAIAVRVRETARTGLGDLRALLARK